MIDTYQAGWIIAAAGAERPQARKVRASQGRMPVKGGRAV